jgi:hypothetical protein
VGTIDPNTSVATAGDRRRPEPPMPTCMPGAPEEFGRRGAQYWVQGRPGRSGRGVAQRLEDRAFRVLADALLDVGLS